MCYRDQKFKILFFTIRYHGSSSSIKCHVYHHIGGKDTHPRSATKGKKPYTSHYPSRSVTTKKTTNKPLIPATIPIDRQKQILKKAAMIYKFLNQSRICGKGVGFKGLFPPDSLQSQLYKFIEIAHI